MSAVRLGRKEGGHVLKRLKKFAASVGRGVLLYLRRVDKLLILLSLGCAAYGCVLISSAVLNDPSGARTVPVQIVAIALGFVAMLVISNINYEVFAYFAKWIALACLVLLIVTLFIGTGREGADDQAWIRIGSISIQPSEFVKIGFILTFSAHLNRVQEHLSAPGHVVLLCIHGMIPVGMIVLQQDFGSALVFCFIFISMMFIAGLKLRYFAAAGILLLIAAPLVWFFALNDFHRQRILVAFAPEQDPLNYGYQQYYGRMAIGSGGLQGLGLYQGIQTQSGYVSEAQNDFIFAVAGEELGFLGAALILVLLAAIIVRVLMIAFRAPDMQGRLICVGVASMLLFQTLINVGMCLCLMPVIGITLPFFSSGGSSMVACFLAIGLVEGVRLRSAPVSLEPGTVPSTR